MEAVDTACKSCGCLPDGFMKTKRDTQHAHTHRLPSSRGLLKCCFASKCFRDPPPGRQEPSRACAFKEMELNRLVASIPAQKDGGPGMTAFQMAEKWTELVQVGEQVIFMCTAYLPTGQMQAKFPSNQNVRNFPSYKV